MHSGSDLSYLGYAQSKIPRTVSRPSSKSSKWFQNSLELKPSQSKTPSSSFLANLPKQEYVPKIFILPSEDTTLARAGKPQNILSKNNLIQKYNLNKSADKYTDRSHLQKEPNYAKDLFLNPKEILPPKPRKFSDSNSNFSQIMQKLQKKEELIQQIQKVCENKVSDNVRRPSIDKHKVQSKNELYVPKYPMNNHEKSTDKLPQKMVPQIPKSPTSKLTNYLSQMESNNKLQKTASTINKNPEESFSNGTQRAPYIWSKQPKPQYQPVRGNERQKKSIQRVKSHIQISTRQQNAQKTNYQTGRLNPYPYGFSNTFSKEIDSLSRKNSKQKKSVQYPETKGPQNIAKELRTSIQTKGFSNRLGIPSTKKVSIYDFNLKKTLGQGKFGVVYQAFHIQTNTLYAIKKISKQVIKSNLMVDQLLQEIKIQFYCNHQNILKIYGFFDDSQFIYLILEYMEEGTLFSLFKKQKTLTEKEAANKLKHITQGIVYLQSKGIAHRDIKPENVVISNGVGKLCDFGWAAICNDRRKTYCGTFDYVAPEILEGTQYDETVDLWCLGVMAYELMVGKAPFYHISRQQTMKKIMNVQKTALEFPSHLSKNAVSFVESLIKKNPEQRLNGQDILAHPFFTQHEDALAQKRYH